MIFKKTKIVATRQEAHMVDLAKNDQALKTTPRVGHAGDHESGPDERKQVSIGVAIGMAIIIAGILLVIGIIAYKTGGASTDIDI